MTELQLQAVLLRTRILFLLFECQLEAFRKIESLSMDPATIHSIARFVPAGLASPCNTTTT